MNNLEKAQKLKKYYDRKVESSGKNSCCIQFAKNQAKEFLEEIKKEIIGEKNDNFINRELMVELEETKKICEGILG